MIDIAHIVHTQHAIGSIYVTKACNLALSALLQHLPASTENDRWTQSHRAQITYSMLRRLGLLLLPHNGDKRDKCEAEVRWANAELELTQRLQKHGGFNVPHGASHLDETNICHLRIFILVRDRGNIAVDRLRLPMSIPVIIHWNMRHLLDPILNLIRNVRHHLHRLTQVIPPSLLPDNLPVHLPGGNIVIARQRNGKETFVVSQV
mmetsp:Transcript_10271/g.21684  ORF Transcript_10271/g.21684 Transcript_10271/m.21684 type:complete len:206 (-) Transcript_10271:291-908(-)